MRSNPWIARSSRLASLLLGAAIVLSAPVAEADGRDGPLRKAGRGASGLFAGILEIPGNIVQDTRDNGPVRGATIGLAKGVGMLVVRELVGLYELLSAPLAFPSGFRPILEPEYPWDYFRRPRRGPRY